MEMTPREKRIVESGWDGLIDYHSGKILERFVEEGGKGLRSALYLAFVDIVSLNDLTKTIDKNKLK